MKLSGILFIILGSLLFVGGVTGYIIKNSLPSLLGSSVFFLSLLYCGKKSFAAQVQYELGGLIISFLSCLFFSYRTLKTQSFFPGTIFIFLSAVVVIFVCASIRKRISSRPQNLNSADSNQTNKL